MIWHTVPKAFLPGVRCVHSVPKGPQCADAPWLARCEARPPTGGTEPTYVVRHVPGRRQGGAHTFIAHASAPRFRFLPVPSQGTRRGFAWNCQRSSFLAEFASAFGSLSGPLPPGMVIAQRAMLREGRALNALYLQNPDEIGGGS